MRREVDIVAGVIAVAIAMWSPEAGCIYGIALAVFFLNPLNDPMRPDSLMSYFHPENVDIREGIVCETGCASCAMEGSCDLIEWPQIAPYFVATSWAIIYGVGKWVIGLF